MNYPCAYDENRWTEIKKMINLITSRHLCNVSRKTIRIRINWIWDEKSNREGDNWWWCVAFSFFLRKKKEKGLNLFFSISYVDDDWNQKKSNHVTYPSDQFNRFSRKVLAIRRWLSFHLIFVVYLRTDRSGFLCEKGSTFSSLIPLDMCRGRC